MTETDEQFRRKLARLANATLELMDGTTEPIQQLFEQGDIVFGVWRDASKPCGVDYHVLKGGKLLRRSVADQKSVTARIVAIPVECLEQAVAAKQVFGERDLDS